MRKFFCLFLIIFFCVNANAHAVFAKADGEIIIWGDDSFYSFDLETLSAFLGELDQNEVEKAIEKICQKENTLPINAKLEYHKDAKETFTVKKEINGRTVDREKLFEDLRNLVSVGGGSARLCYNYTAPQILSKDLVNSTHQRARFTTYFADNLERAQNIKLATMAINGTNIGAGETFSFNEIVGERNAERGYKMAKIIVNGEFVEGVGGGVCQVSTTLYNTALLSGLMVTEHHQHSLAVNYIDKSFDAMVNSNQSDLKFVNCSNSPILIVGEVGENYVAFTIFGEKQEYVFERESVIIEEITPSVTTVPKAELEEDERVVISPKVGYRSQGYLKTYLNGNLIKREKIRDDTYLAINGITEVKLNEPLS